MVSRSMVTGPPVSATARFAGSSDSIRPVIRQAGLQIAFHWAGVIRRASPRQS